MLLYIASRVLSSITKQLFEAEHHSNDAPDITVLLKCIHTRCQLLQNTTVMSPSVKHTSYVGRKSSQIKSSFTTSTEVKNSCLLRKESFFLFQCLKFEEMLIKDRFKFAQSGIYVWIVRVHDIKRSTVVLLMHVDIVSSKHHSLLHLEKCNPIISLLNNQEQDPNISPTMITPTIDNNSEPSVKFSWTVSTSSTIVLGTILVSGCRFDHSLIQGHKFLWWQMRVWCAWDYHDIVVKM